MSNKWLVFWLVIYGLACAGAALTFGAPGDLLIVFWAIAMPFLWDRFQWWRVRRILRGVYRMRAETRAEMARIRRMQEERDV